MDAEALLSGPATKVPPAMTCSVRLESFHLGGARFSSHPRWGEAGSEDPGSFELKRPVACSFREKVCRGRLMPILQLGKPSLKEVPGLY